MTYNPDVVAVSLARLGRMARQMPPSWDGAKVTALAAGDNGKHFGLVLPGRGLYLRHDLKALGITRPLPHVFEQTAVGRTVEAMDRFGHMRGYQFDAERGALKFLHALRVLSGRLLPACAITSYDGVINARAGGKGEDITFTKLSVTGAANSWTSLFRGGGFPGVGTYTNIPGGAVMLRSNVGALSLGLTNPAGTDLKYLLTIGLTSAAAQNFYILVDLLVAAGNILATTAAAQTVNSAALTRYIDAASGLYAGAGIGSGVLMTFEITTQMSATAHTITVSYTNQAGTAAQSSGAQTGINAGIVGRLAPTDLGPYCPLAAGDFGVRSVQTVTIGTALVAGVYALNLYKPLAFLPGVAASVYAERDSTVQIDGLTQLAEDSGGVLGCLVLYLQPSATSTACTGFLRTCSG